LSRDSWAAIIGTYQEHWQPVDAAVAILTGVNRLRVGTRKILFRCRNGPGQEGRKGAKALDMRACLPLLATLALAAPLLASCRDQSQPPPASKPARPPFALPLAAGPSPPAPFAPTVDALPPASSPLPVTLAEGPERYRQIDQALGASEAFAASPPDYVVSYRGTPVSVWRSDNGWIRAVERLADGERAYFYRALTEQPYLIAGPGAAYGYDRDELAAAYDNDGRALASLDASHRVIPAARLLDRGRALHARIMQSQHEAAHQDWQPISAAADAQRLRWRHGLGEQADWRDWHEDQTADRETRWAAEREQRLAYVATLRVLPAPQPSHPQPEAAPALALAAAPAQAAEPVPPATQPKPPAAPPAVPAKTSGPAATASKPAAAHRSEPPRKRTATAKAKRKAAKTRKRPRRAPQAAAMAQPQHIEAAAEAQHTESPAKARRRNRPPKFLRDVGDFLDRTFGSGVRVHRNAEPPTEE